MNALASRVRAALQDERGSSARGRAFGMIRPKVEQTIAGFPELALNTRRLKLAALDRNAELVSLARERMEANGMRVYVADTAVEAVAHVRALMPSSGLVVKSKSNLGKELHLAEALTDAGLTVIETDLGDRINQMAGTTGFHVLSPAASIDRFQVRDLFSRELGEELGDSPEELVAAARRSLRGYFARADYGLVGANAIAADTGSVCLMENEGNIRAATALPRVVVVVAAITKIVPTLEEAWAVARAASVFAGGQDFATYVTCLSGPTPDGGGPEEVHVVLVDDGRSRAIAEGYAEAFACINCGGCLNFCPIYGQIGDGFAGKRVGGIGALQTWLLDGREAAEQGGASLCIKCGKCRTICPVQLDTPRLLTRLQTEAVTRREAPAFGRAADRLMAALVVHPTLLAGFGSLARAYARTGFQRLVRRTGVLRALKLDAAERLLPPPSTPPAVAPSLAPTAPERARVFFFRGCLSHELLGGVTTATLDVLRANGCRVLTPREQVCCGAIHEHAGDEDAARSLARRNIDAFRGEELIISNSGGCGATLKEYATLLADDPDYADAARAFAARVRDLSEFLAQLGPAPMKGIHPAVSVTYQDSCHLSLLQGIRDEPRALLHAVPGWDLREMQPREFCCGSGGLWGLKHTELSARLREVKLEDAAASGASIIVTGNPGCHMHLQGGPMPVVHMAEVLAAAYRGGSLATGQATDDGVAAG
ncbi:MAG: LUD domain-containing protein [Actinobacteria bacterium]|nr:LUD domain-containing protein [Actinomycetota bacterium]